WAAAVGPGEPLARQPRCGSLVHDGHYAHPATRGLASDVRPSRGLPARAERLLLSKPCSRRTPSPMTPSSWGPGLHTFGPDDRNSLRPGQELHSGFRGVRFLGTGADASREHGIAL